MNFYNFVLPDNKVRVPTIPYRGSAVGFETVDNTGGFLRSVPYGHSPESNSVSDFHSVLHSIKEKCFVLESKTTKP